MFVKHQPNMAKQLQSHTTPSQTF